MDVSIHAPTGARHGKRARSSPDRGFNSRAHGGATRRDAPLRLISCFNSRAHGGATYRIAPGKIENVQFQFTRPRGRDVRSAKRGARRVVSIHAPTGARRWRTRGGLQLPQVSIHAPTGARHPRGRREPSPHKFQFTRPRGRDRARVRRIRNRNVSIHAPTGARHSITGYLKRRLEFQFTRPRGRDRSHGGNARSPEKFQFTRPRGRDGQGGTLGDGHAEKFQFTRPRGRDTFCGRKKSEKKCFNSRAHGGATHGDIVVCDADAVSIHAPTGARPSAAARRIPVRRFQFTRPRGRDEPREAQRAQSQGFNSRAHGGATGLAPLLVLGAEVSIHAPTGARLSLLAGCVYRGAFQFTRPRGRDLAHAGEAAAVGVSIHAPTGARPSQRAAPTIMQKFQFTRPRGRDCLYFIISYR